MTNHEAGATFEYQGQSVRFEWQSMHERFSTTCDLGRHTRVLFERLADDGRRVHALGADELHPCEQQKKEYRSGLQDFKKSRSIE